MKRPLPWYVPMLRMERPLPVLCDGSVVGLGRPLCIDLSTSSRDDRHDRHRQCARHISLHQWPRRRRQRSAKRWIPYSSRHYSHVHCGSCHIWNLEMQGLSGVACHHYGASTVRDSSVHDWLDRVSHILLDSPAQRVFCVASQER